ncbi:4Fe-4S binding protein [Alkaliphilus transvaalensis]|uniref:4Fe-4S binding protein n=1 Tax=Alkaliphilus transvaalensis TaxID=114628 RepID=UPI000479AB8F|nr:4Fe-4S binding protein [Alkaliphilus transvaalensis]
MEWTKEAEERVKKAPFFIRKMAKKKAEDMAISRGKTYVDVEDIELAKGIRDLEDLSKIDLSIDGITETKYLEIKPCGGLKGCPLTLFEDENVIRTLSKIIKQVGLEDLMASQNQGPMLYHKKFKAAISGCPNSCSQPQIRDLGVVGYARPIITEGHCIGCQQCVKSCPEGLITVDAEPNIHFEACIDCGRCINSCPTSSITSEEQGYRVIIGGRLGRRPHLAQQLIEVSSLEELEDLLTKLIQVYMTWIKDGKKISQQVESLGWEGVKELLLLTVGNH